MRRPLRDRGLTRGHRFVAGLIGLTLTVGVITATGAGATQGAPKLPSVKDLRHFLGTNPEGWLLAPPSKLLSTAELTLPTANSTSSVPASTAVTQQWKVVLNNANKYALGAWWDENFAHVVRNFQYPDGLLKSEDPRKFASEAYGLAVSLATGAYDPKITYVDRGEAYQRTVELVTFLATNHRANRFDGGGWGGAWQSSYWAAMTAQAAWLLGAELPVPVSLAVGRMLESEANSTLLRPIHYYRDRSGTVLTKGDTGAEEVAWDGYGLFTAVELLPFNPNRAKWASSAYRRMAAAYARPSDVTSTTVVSGMDLSLWLDGSNAEQSGLVVNHGRLNPDYTAQVTLNLASSSLTPLLGDAIPDAARFNAGRSYSALENYRFDNGQTIYQPGSMIINYPNGSSWGNRRPILFATLDAQMRALGFGMHSSPSAADYEKLHLKYVILMQQRSTTGQSYLPGDDDRYPLREELVAAYTGLAWLTDWVAARHLVSWTPAGFATKAPMSLTGLVTSR